jgi:hypothetical protein
MVPECVQNQIHQTKIHCHNDNEQEANRRGVELLEMVVFKLTSFAGFHAVGDSREARYRGRTPIFYSAEALPKARHLPYWAC